MNEPLSSPQRDPRLDFFRGLAILIIFIAHIPENPWANYTPGRFGFSDAAEIFIFVSGFAVALAFGRLSISGLALSPPPPACCCAAANCTRRI
jgi:hypothetical protein